jgi:sulfonate transport system permease protein
MSQAPGDKSLFASFSPEKEVSPFFEKKEANTLSFLRGFRVPSFLTSWVVPVLLVVAWEVLTASGIVPARKLPSPHAVLLAFWKLLKSGELPRDVLVSTIRAATGFAIGGGLGFVFGLAAGISRLTERAVDSTLQMLRMVPHLALIPLVIVWFGIGESAKVFLVAVGVFFPIYYNTYHGIRSIDQGLMEMARIQGLSGFALFREVIFPGALPSILVGVRYSLGIMWLTLIVAETIAGNSGIGFMTMNAREFMQTDVVLLGILLYAVLGKIIDMAARSIERGALAWHPSLGQV